jgi:septal ring factor EnvC (AmiA/AmiB activator)
MRKKIFFAFCLFLGISFIIRAQPPQDKTQLEKERQEIQKEIQQLQNEYNKVKGQTKISLKQLNMLSSKIKLQEKYIGSINREIQSIDDDIYLSNVEIYRLQKQLDTLKAQYARSVVYAYKNRSNYDYLNFIFSARSFNDAIRRISYLKSYRAYREQQVATIMETKQLIARRKEQQEGRVVQKKNVLENQIKQKEELAVQQKEKDAVVSKLKSEEKNLSKEIAAKKKKDRDLLNSINAIVRREIEASKLAAKKRADEEAKKNAAANPVTNPSANPSIDPATTSGTSRIKTTTVKPTIVFNSDADIKLNAGFEGNRGKLPWPVDNGFVNIHFGPYNIEGTLLKGDNPGITISTQTGNAVKSVFDGEVVGVYNLGDGMAITIRHGRYFTTYSNLTGVVVSKGATVKTGQMIGKAGRDDDGNGGQIDFILMIETKNVNPEPWLHR